MTSSAETIGTMEELLARAKEREQRAVLNYERARAELHLATLERTYLEAANKFGVSHAVEVKIEVCDDRIGT